MLLSTSPKRLQSLLFTATILLALLALTTQSNTRAATKQPDNARLLYEQYRKATWSEKQALLGHVSHNPSVELAKNIWQDLQHCTPPKGTVCTAMQKQLVLMPIQTSTALKEVYNTEEKINYRLMEQILIQIGKTSPETLTNWLDDPNYMAVLYGLNALCKSDSEQAKTILYEFDPQKTPEISTSYLGCLIDLNQTLGQTRISEYLSNNKNKDLLQGALNTVQNKKLTQLLPLVVPLLISTEQNIARQAAQVLALLGVAGIEAELEKIFFALPKNLQIQLVFGLSGTQSPEALALLKRVVKKNGVDRALGRFAREGIKKSGEVILDTEGEVKPAHLVVEHFFSQTHTIRVAFLTDEGVSIKKAATLKIGCCGKKRKTYKITTGDFNNGGSLDIRLNCKPEPCNGACVEIFYRDNNKHKLKKMVDLDAFFSC